MTLEELQALLQPSQADRDNALNMGLLQAGLGILAHNTNKSNPMPALGAGGLMGLQGYQQSMQNFPLEKLRSLQAMSAMQGIEKGDMELKALKDQLAMKERIRKRMSGEQPQATPEPYGGGYSPAVASAFGIPQTAPQAPQKATGGLNQSLSDSFIRQAQIYAQEGDIDGANKLYEHAAKFLPQVEKMSVEMVGGKPMNVILFKDGTHKIAPFAPVDKKEYKDIGGSLMPVSGITGDVLPGGIGKTMSPSDMVSMRGQNMTDARERFLGSPQNQGAVASAKEFGVSNAKSAIALPDAVAKAEQAISEIDGLIGKRDSKGNLLSGQKPHPGFEVSVGASWMPFGKFIPGTDAADFNARLDQIKGSAFMQAYEGLKGGGQITEVEGAKATAAITRMSTAQSEKEFIQAANEFKGIIKSGMNRAKMRGASSGGGVKFLGFE